MTDKQKTSLLEFLVDEGDADISAGSYRHRLSKVTPAAIVASLKDIESMHITLAGKIRDLQYQVQQLQRT